MALPDLDLKPYKPTDLQRQIEGLVTNGVGMNINFHSEESVLAVQEHLGTLEKSTGNPAPDLEDSLTSMRGILETNDWVQRGWTAGGMLTHKEFDTIEELASLVDGMNRLKRQPKLLPRLMQTNQTFSSWAKDKLEPPYKIPLKSRYPLI